MSSFLAHAVRAAAAVRDHLGGETVTVYPRESRPGDAAFDVVAVFDPDAETTQLVDGFEAVVTQPLLAVTLADCSPPLKSGDQVTARGVIYDVVAVLPDGAAASFEARLKRA